MAIFRISFYLCLCINQSDIIKLFVHVSKAPERNGIDSGAVQLLLQFPVLCDMMLRH